MAIPYFYEIMLPLLKYLSDEEEHSLREAIDTLADRFKLTDAQRRELLPSGRQSIFDNRVGWARTYMKKAGLIESTRRGFFRITPRGLQVISDNPSKIDVKFLEQFEEFRNFTTIRKTKSGEEIVKAPLGTPEETLESAYLALRDNLAKELIQQIKASSPSLFETIVVELLVKMGYGGSREDAGKAVGKSGDEGIDGFIKEDRLGLDIVYIQAKKWENTIGRPEIQKFAGALQGQRARKGIFITTSDFSRDAYEFASRIENKIILIDGQQLAQFMIDYNVGVSPQANYEVKKIDLDYFSS